MDLKLYYPLAFSLTAIALLIAGMWLLVRVSGWGERHPLRPYLLQILGLTFILPVVLVAAVAERLNDQALSALLGGMVAFVFGGRIAVAGDRGNGSQTQMNERTSGSTEQTPQSRQEAEASNKR